MKAINIKWDVDDEKDLENLPKEIYVPLEMTDEEEISDYITDLTGFCHKGFELVERLHIAMAYTFVGDTGIDIPVNLLEGKTEEEKYDIAYAYAQDHIDEIPVAKNAEYIAYSDNFERDDIDFEQNDEKEEEMEF